MYTLRAYMAIGLDEVIGGVELGLLTAYQDHMHMYSIVRGLYGFTTYPL